jgi:DNA-binding transcriptional MerR regulator
MGATTSSFTISELAEETHIPIARIKFYLRERMLPLADLAAEKRAFYQPRHAQRLRLIHTLREVAGLSVPAIRALCRQLDAPQGDLASVVLQVIDALGRAESKRSALSPREQGHARQELYTFLRERGLSVRPDSPALAELARALVGLREVLHSEVAPQGFAPYLDAMLSLAEHDFASTRHLITDRASAGLAATFGTVLYEPVLVLLRRIAHEHVAAQQLGTRAPPARKRKARR